MNKLFYNTIKKYGFALIQNLHPSQSEKLKEALNAYEQKKPYSIKDPFVKLAFEMIVADLLWQEERQGKINEEN